MKYYPVLNMLMTDDYSVFYKAVNYEGVCRLICKIVESVMAQNIPYKYSKIFHVLDP
jgi:hypothetical protein